MCWINSKKKKKMFKCFNNTKDFPAEYQQIRMRIPDNSIQLENIKEHVKTMTCIPVTIACVCARGKFWCISTLSVFVLMYIYIICICLDVYLHYLYLSWCISTLSVFVLTYIYIIRICLDVYLHYLYLSWRISTLSVFVLMFF